jgi:intracellular septation protein A
MSVLRRIYPFNAEQTVNILSEFGPLVTMFIVNAAAGINAGTWALIISTVIAMVVMRMVLGRFPVFPIIASSVTIAFGVMTLVTKDPMWVQIKVSIFNALFGGFLFGGLFATSEKVGRFSLITVIGLTVVASSLQAPLVLEAMNGALPALGDQQNPLFANLLCIGSLVVGFLIGTMFKRNFFGYVFEKTFHYTQEGWDRFTYSFAWFFIFTAVLNEVVRQVFKAETFYPVPFIGEMNGVNIWILFKIAFIMPISGLYAWYLTRLMQPYRIEPPAREPAAPLGQPAGATAYAMASARRSPGQKPS